MRRRVPQFPPYPKKPHPSGQARIKIPGQRGHTYLGKYDSPGSWARYQQHLAEWRASEAERTAAGAAASPSLSRLTADKARTVGDLLARFWAYAETHYRNKDGLPKRELISFCWAIRPVDTLYGHALIEDFGPVALKAVQRAMIDGSWMTAAELADLRKKGRGIGWCRRTVNRMTVRVKTIWNWGVGQQIVPEAKANALDKVRGLELDQWDVRETEDVPPAPEEDLEKVLAVASPVLYALIQTLLQTGARPGEIVELRPMDLNRTGKVEAARNYWVQLGEVWAFQPRRHKMAKRGHRRVILFGPKLQAVLAPLMEGRPEDRPIFSPTEAEAWRHARQRDDRKTPVQPSQQALAKAGRKRPPGDRYTVDSLTKSIKFACRRASVKPFSAYQLRHNAATRILEEFGPEVTKTILGHKTFDMLATYALDSLRKAAEAMRQSG